jgi:hypothetical protein
MSLGSIAKKLQKLLGETSLLEFESQLRQLCV